MCTHYYCYAVLLLYSAVLRQYAVIAIFLKNKFTLQTTRPRIIFFHPKNIALIFNMKNSQLYPYDIKKKKHCINFIKKTTEYGAITLILVFLSFQDEKKTKIIIKYILTQSGQNRIL